MTESMRRIIAVNHIFKHAGTTLARIMRGNFGKGFVDHLGLIERGVRTIQPLADCIRREPNIKAVEIHHFFYDRFDMDGVAVDNILLLRDPWARIRSTYDFCRVSTEQLLHPYASKMNLAEFIRFIAFEWGRGHCDNFVTRCLNNKGDSKIACRKPAPQVMPQTIERMRSVEILGVVERFDETMVLAEEHLRPFFPNIDMAYVPANVTQKSNRSLHTDRHDEFREILGDEVFENIQGRCALDFELLAEANREMDRRIAAVEHFELKLEKFRNRCLKVKRTKAAVS